MNWIFKSLLLGLFLVYTRRIINYSSIEASCFDPPSLNDVISVFFWQFISAIDVYLAFVFCNLWQHNSKRSLNFLPQNLLLGIVENKIMLKNVKPQQSGNKCPLKFLKHQFRTIGPTHLWYDLHWPPCLLVDQIRVPTQEEWCQVRTPKWSSVNNNFTNTHRYPV